jgi:phage gp16-like protein
MLDRNALIRKIMVAKRQMPGMEEEYTYRAFLKSITGKDSLKKMAARELLQIVEGFRSRGWQEKPGKYNFKRSPDARVRMLFALWTELHQRGAVQDVSREALRKWCRRMTGIETFDWMNDRHLDKAINSLKGWIERLDREEAERSLERLERIQQEMEDICDTNA